MSLQGATQLRTRLKALKVAFKPVGRAWAEETVRQINLTGPRRSGKGVRSARVKNASQKRATVAAIFYMHIIDQGNKAYDIKPRKAGRLRFEVGGKTIFASKVHRPARGGTNFGGRAGKEALRRNPLAESLIREWNAAA